MNHDSADAVIVGAGLAGLAAAAELINAGKRVVILDQESERSLGGQAFWSFGGLFLVDSPEQRRMGIHDSRDLAWQDWQGAAEFDRAEDEWPRKWAEEYVDFAAGEQRSWLHQQGVRFFPLIMWAERGGALANGHGNTVPRFHITWGTGPGLLEPFIRSVRDGQRRGLVSFRFRHRVTELTSSAGAIDGVRGVILEPTNAERGAPTSRVEVGEFALRAPAVIMTAGGIGANFDLVRSAWPSRLGRPPTQLLSGVPDHVDGSMLIATEAAGAAVINRDRMWHYCEGIRNHAPIWSQHGIRILPGPSSIWLDAFGQRMHAPCLPGFDTLSTLERILAAGYTHSWFILNQRIIRKEFALSGSEQNPDLTGRSIRHLLRRVGGGPTPPVQAFVDNGADFIVEPRLDELVRRMNDLAGEPLLDADAIERQITARDRELDNPYGKDVQVAMIRAARRYRGDRLIRVAALHRILDPKAGPLIAVRLHVLTRKTLGGLQTDLSGRVLTPDGSPLAGVYAAGEIAGFGGGGMHGYRSLEGTFLGGCLFSGRTVGRSVARVVDG